MDQIGSLSSTASRLRPSPIRELFRTIQRPGMISFAGGLPDPAIFPVAAFAESASAIESAGATALQYGATEGFPPLVGIVGDRMTRHLGRAVRAEEILITTGSQQAMDLLGRVLVDPGDVVVVEAPTYPGALHTFRNLGARFALVPCDGDGMIVERLSEVIAAVKVATGRFPKLIYSIVNFSNPSGACLAEDRRLRVLEIAAGAGIPILEDDPYGELRFSGEPIPALASLGWPGVVYAGSFSKILAPGVRLGWMVGPPSLIRPMVMVKQGVDLCTSTVDQMIVAEYCRRGHLDRHLDAIRTHYARKRDAMAAALSDSLPQGAATWETPAGGFFFWLQLGRDAEQVFRDAVGRGVAFLPGSAFFPPSEELAAGAADGSRFARLCFTFASPDEIAEGCRRFAAALA